MAIRIIVPNSLANQKSAHDVFLVLNLTSAGQVLRRDGFSTIRPREALVVTLPSVLIVAGIGW